MAALEITALIEITLNGSTISLKGNGTRLEANLPNLQTVLLIKKISNRWLSTLHTLLSSSGVQLDLRLQDAEVGRMGYGARPTLMGRLAGCIGVELHFFRIVCAVSKTLLDFDRASQQT